MGYSILLALFLILYSNLIIFKTLQQTTTVKTIKDYFNYDDKSLVFINLLMFLLSGLIIIVSHLVQLIN
jgi:hypothetical protein